MARNMCVSVAHVIGVSADAVAIVVQSGAASITSAAISSRARAAGGS